MKAPRQEPLFFRRGRGLLQAGASYAGQEGYVGLCDGRVVAQGPTRAEVVGALLRRTAYP